MHSKIQIQLIADTLLPSFLPKDPAEKKLSFNFTLPPDDTYLVKYEKSVKAEWEFISFEKVII